MALLVLDASVVVALYVEEEASASAHDALVKAAEVDAQLHAPDLLLIEVANALWKRVSREELDQQDAMMAIGDLSSLEALILHPLDDGLAPKSLSLALSHGLTAYDAAYAALAAALGGILVSGDRKLLAGARDFGVVAVDPVDLLYHL